MQSIFKRFLLCAAALVFAAMSFTPVQAQIYGPYGYPRRRLPRPRRESTGSVKLKTHASEAAVYVDGAYAGIAKKLKSFPLKPGKHEIEIRDTSGASYSERVQVLRGKSVTVNLDFGSTPPGPR